MIVVGLAGRSAVDKVLALRGGAELVAAWAQLSSVIELVAGAALSGVAAGVTVYVAQAASRDAQFAALRGGTRLGLAVSLAVAICVAPFAVLGAAVGLVAVIPGTLNAFWLGQQRRAAMLALAIVTALLALAAALLAPRDWIVAALAIAAALPALAGFLVLRELRGASLSEPLRRYILPGLAVGILGPASLVVARAAVGDALSWHDAGVLQALWRLADWVAAVAAGILWYVFLPQLAAARSNAEFNALVARAAKLVLLPSALVFAGFYSLHRPLLSILYEPSVAASDTAVALLLAGSWVRIVAWLPLFALYALRRTRAIAVGEMLSLPLFAVLVVAAGERLSLELACGFWLVAYIAYAAFNVWAARR
jgi:O-antigen/teichoic acid export membrane protein